LLLRSTGVSFCTGAHFGMDDEATLIRLAFSAIRSQKEATALGNPTIEAAMVKLNNWMTERDAAIQFWTGKNILVFGGGPIGMHVAGCLSAYTKATVTMVTRDADRLSGGYVIEFPTGKETMRPNVVKPGREGELGQADVAIVAVKNGEIPPGLRAVVGDHTRIICFQNGVDGNAIADAFPDNPVDRVAIYVQTRRLEKEVGITIPKEIKWVFGPARATGDAAATAEIARMFGHAGLYNATGIDHKHHTTASWEKLFNNIGNYAALRLAVANEGRTYGDVLSDSPAAKEARALMIKAVEEATEIAIAHGVELKHRHYGEAVLTYLKTTHVCTTVAAFENGDPIEVLLAPVIQLGKAYGHSTDALEAINQPVLDHNAARTPHPEIKTRLSESELEHRLQVCITEISVVPT
ncbi:hypothetical protein EBR96_09465, partial [bacterium]|nr:hypothetical protein [bacterium]